jgi:acyl-coenzyme A synthetase/AMP-(fatty) acid ligase
VLLIGHEAGKGPAALAALISRARLSIWYSAPSILSLLVQYGDLAKHDFSALRMIFFAGEVFPVRYLRDFKRLIPRPRYFNLYGPTETNVCTYFEIPETVPDDRTEPYPIGKVCSHLEGLVVDEHGQAVQAGQEGELCIDGPAVTRGYWNLPEQTARAFLATDDGRRWYRTGDIVVQDAYRDYMFRGRRDRMVKKRGYRVELGEIEACLYQHPAVQQVAVIALPGEESVRIKAFLSTHEGQRLSLIALKTFCAEQLPTYMVPDLFSFHERLPTTSTDKVDYQRLAQLA